jgi:3-(methylthio)propionyl---CoA ligase
MHGLMMKMPLTITSIMRHAERNHPQQEIVSVTHDNPRHRLTFEESFGRARQLAGALTELGMGAGDRIGTLAWNDYRHFEIYYGVSCAGAVCHTINPRLFQEQIAYIINHARDRWLFVDLDFVPLLEELEGQLDSVEGVVVMTDEAHMPESSLPRVRCYESLLATRPARFDWPEIDEETASSLCYTSGTTGNPKGVLYSHRSTVLHALSCCLPDVMCLSAHDGVMPIVPMFHASAWGTPYAVPLVGAKLVFPGAKLSDGQCLQSLITEERVTCSMGVPTVWLALLDYLDQTDKPIDPLNRVAVGGSACPRSIMRRFTEDYGVAVHHAWGMTETSPLGTFNRLHSSAPTKSKEQLEELQAKQGHGVYGIEMKIADDAGNPLPWDGQSQGTLKVRGSFVCRDYFCLDGAAKTHDSEGWFDTGDVATIDPEGVMQIVDRTKDIIKSGGEWISSIDLENNAIGHPAVAAAAVIGKPHAQWGERPLLVVVRQEGAALDQETLLAWFSGKVAKWWIPDEVLFVDELPLTATGKLDKRELRRRLSQLRD